MNFKDYLAEAVGHTFKVKYYDYDDLDKKHHTIKETAQGQTSTMAAYHVLDILKKKGWVVVSLEIV